MKDNEKLAPKKNGDERPVRASGEHDSSWRNLRVFVPRNMGALLGIFKSLKHRNFAIYFAGQSVSLVGSWMQQIAMGWLVYRLTESVFMLSLAVFLSQIPILVLAPFTGVFSDRFSRKNIMLATQSLMMLQALALGILSATNIATVEIVYVLCLCFGVLTSFEAPARQSLYSKMVPPEDLSNAIALNSTVINASRFIGPAIGGMILARYGEAVCFFANTISFSGILLALSLIKIEKTPPLKTSAVEGILEGFSYIAHSVPIRAILALVMAFSFFGSPFPLLLPAFVRGGMGLGAEELGLMMSSIGAGSLCGALYLAARKNVFGLSRVIMASCALFGLGLVAISHVKIPTLAYVLCFPIGFGLVTVAASCNTMLQSLVDDSKRGRVMSVFTMAIFGFAPVGSIVQGFCARYVSYEAIVLVCGLVCIVTAAVLEHYRATIRIHARKIYAEKGMVMPEMAESLRNSSAKL